MSGRQGWKSAATAAPGPVPGLVTSREIPPGCLCDWRPADYQSTGPGFSGWLLKFTHRLCPVLRQHGDGYGR